MILNSSVSGSANANYSLSGGNSKFQINSSTGQVTLVSPLDYESASSHTFSISATVNGETEIETFTLNVDDHIHTLSDSAPSSDAVKKGTFHHSSVNNDVTYLIDEDITSQSGSARVIGDFGTGIAGTSYSLAGADNAFFEIDSEGVLSIKTNANALLEVQESAQTAAHTFQLEVKADIPGEPQVSTETILLQGKNVESSENLVMKFASGYSSKVHNFQGANPFKAIGIRNDHTQGFQMVTESTLSVAVQEVVPM